MYDGGLSDVEQVARAVIQDVIDRLERPRFYAGNWPGDMAGRVIQDLHEAGFEITRRVASEPEVEPNVTSSEWESWRCEVVDGSCVVYPHYTVVYHTRRAGAR